MPSRDYIVKLAGDSRSYQSAMEQASRSLDKFGKQNLSVSAAMNVVTSTMTKFLSVAALVKGAQEAITATINGSQTTADQFNATLTAAKDTVNTFFSSLSTGDFSQFNMGLDNLIAKSKEAYMALDRLGNASMSWGYFHTARMADLTDLQAVVNDKSLPMEQRQQAAAQMKDIQEELQGYAKSYEQRAIEAMAREMTKATNLEWTDVGRQDLEKVLGLDLLSTDMSEQEKQRLQARYQEYLSEVKKYEEQFNKESRRYERQAVKDSFGATVAWQKVDVTPQEDLDLRAMDLRDIAREYQDAVLYNQILVRGSDEWLQNLIQLVQQADNAERSMRRVNSAVQQAQNIQPAAAGAPAAAGSNTASKNNYMSPLEYDRLILQERLKLTQKYSDDYIDLQQQIRETEYQMQVERLTATIEDEQQLATALEIIERVKQQDLYDIAMQGYVARLQLAEQFTGQMQSVGETSDNVADNFTTMRDSLQGIGDSGRALESLGRAMSTMSDNRNWQGVGNLVSSVGAAAQAYMQLAAAAQIAATSTAAAETPTIWGKIAAVTTMLSVFATMISQVRSMSNYAEGGIIPGHNWNDGITARVSSGEMVINEADQKRLYDSIHTGNMGGGGGGPAYISGEQIVLAVNNYGRRTGQGELVFAGR